MRPRLHFAILMVIFSVFAVACLGSDPRRDDDDDGMRNSAGGTAVGSTGSTGSTGGNTGEITHPNGPQFLAFGTNVSAISSGQSVTFSAVLSDPQGVDDIVGGTLRDPTTTTQYGAFITSGQEGAYEMTLWWSDFQQIAPINFNQGVDAQRTLVAEFFDTAGHASSRQISVTLTCSGLGACDGVCTDLSRDLDNCGSCQFECDLFTADLCDRGSCMRYDSTCNAPPTANTCEAVCAGKGSVCSNACGRVGTTHQQDTCTVPIATELTSCSEVLPPGTGAVDCCCLAPG